MRRMTGDPEGPTPVEDPPGQPIIVPPEPPAEPPVETPPEPPVETPPEPPNEVPEPPPEVPPEPPPELPPGPPEVPPLINGALFAVLSADTGPSFATGAPEQRRNLVDREISEKVRTTRWLMVH